jgi:DNA-binding CsgD family transcriptional regulator
VGRASELELLEGALARLGSDGPQIVVVSGEAGIGKTRLIDELVNRHADGRALVLRGGCVEVTRGELPYAPLVQALRSLARQMEPAELLEVLGPARPELARLLPELGEAAADPSNPALAQTRLFELMLGAACRLSERQPLVLVLEDLHWSDPSTRDFLTFLVNSLTDESIMLLGSYRTEEVAASHPMRAFLAGLARSGALRIELDPLTESDVAEQLEAIYESAPGPGVTRKIFKLSQGNPFFAEELAAAGDDELPPTLRDLLLVRVEGLAAPARRLLALLAIAGRPVEHSALAELSGFDDSTMDEAVREAMQKHVIVPDGNQCYVFRHALVREAVYSDLLPAEKARFHGAFAALLKDAAQSPSTSAELAYHCHMTGDLAEALPFSYRAGVQSKNAYAFVEARKHFDRCLEIWDQVSDPEKLVEVDRVTVLSQTAECCSLAGDIERSVTLTRAALDLVDEKADAVRAGMLHERLGRYLWTAADGTGSLRAYREAVRLVPATPPTNERATVLASEGQILMLVARYGEAIELCEEAIAIARPLNEASIEAHALCSLGPATAFMGRLDDAEGFMRDARRISEETGDAQNLGRSYVNHSTVLGIAGRPRAGLELANEGQDVARRWGIARSFGTWMKGEAAFHLLALGRPHEAELLCREILRGDPAGYAGVAHLLLAQAALDRGDLGLVEEHLAPTRADAPAWNSLEYDVPLLAVSAEAAAAQGRFADARRAVTEGLKLTAEGDDRFFTAVLCSVGMRVEADRAGAASRSRGADSDLDRDEVIERLLQEATRAETLEVPPVAAHVATCRAEHSRLDGRSDPGLWAGAAALWAGVEQPNRALYARWREAEALLQSQKEPARARDLLHEAHGAARALNARVLEREIEALAERGRISLDATATATTGGADDLGLTARELEVLLLLTGGLSNKEIADELFISAKTASVHVSRILMKLGVTSRVEAAGIAHKRGLMESDSHG